MIRRWLAVGIILLFVGTCTIPAMAQDTEKPLPTSRGHWLYVGGSGPGNYTKIQDALDNSSDGDTIIVFPGFYQEHVYVKASVTLKGIDYPIVDGNSTYSVFNLAADGVTIDGFVIQNAGDFFARPDYACADINCTGNNVVVKNNRFLGPAKDGVWVLSDMGWLSNILIFNNTLQDTWYGVFTVVSNHVNISNNVFSHHYTAGVELYYCTDSLVSNNLFSNITDQGLYGIRCEWSGEVEIIGNTFQNCNNGLDIEKSGTMLVRKNNFLRNKVDSSFLAFFFNPLRYQSNYWGRALIHPKVIFGGMTPLVLYPLFFPWILFDWRPAQKPYNISGMR